MLATGVDHVEIMRRVWLFMAYPVISKPERNACATGLIHIVFSAHHIFFFMKPFDGIMISSQGQMSSHLLFAASRCGDVQIFRQSDPLHIRLL